MKLRLNLFLLAVIGLTAAFLGAGVWELAREEFARQLEQRIQQTHREVQNKFRSFDLFMQEVEGELDQRLAAVMPQLAQRLAEDGRPLADWRREELNALAAEFKVRDIYFIDHALTVFNTTFSPDQGLNLGSLSENLERRLQSLLGSGRTEVDRISMSNQTGIIKKYAYHGPQGADYLVEASINMWEGAETFGSEVQKRFFLEEFFQSLVDSNDILLELDLFIADDLSQWSLLREGVAMDPAVAARLRQGERVAVRTPDRLTFYHVLPRRSTISGFRYYSKTVFATGLPESLTRGMAMRAVALALAAALVAYLLMEQVITRWLLVRISAIDSGIQHMAGGDYNTPIAVFGKDELSRIAAAGNHLARRIQEREGQLHQAKAELEQRVEERTRELRASLEALARRESNYRYLVEHARSIILRWRPDGTITFFNEFAQEFFGYREGEIIGRNVLETIVPAVESGGRDLSAQLREIARDPGRFAFHENENQCRDGRRVWVAWANRGLPGGDGETTEILSVGTDITHLKRIQHELTLARDAAEAANRAKSAFLAVMSHEIRTPMNAILGMADLLAETPLSGEQQRYVEVFRGAGDTLLLLINDILDLSKIEAQRLELEQVEVDLERLAGDLADMMAPRARQKGLALTMRVDPVMTPVRMGDPARLRQILVNLLGNAIKFTEQGEVRLSLFEALPGRVRFQVDDTGIGIAADKLAGVFEAFGQADASVTRRYGGTGLGLTICKRLVHLMGGTLQVESRLGEGSQFHFTIPMAAVAHAVVQPADHPLPPGLPVMLAGSGVSLPVVRELLESAGVSVIPHGGFSGLAQRLAEENPGLLVIDGGDVNHHQALSTVRQLQAEAERRFPTVILIPEPDHEAFQAALGLRVGCLPKPVKRQELLAALATALQPGEEKPTGDGEPRAGPVEGAAERPLAILLAEDAPDNILLIRAFLKDTPHRLEVVGNGRLAMAKALQGGYDLVLMDVQMPEMDGLSATREIRRQEALAGREPLPIIALTAHAMREDAERSRAAGCTAHLTKPIRKQVLLEAIRVHAMAPPPPGGGEAERTH